MDDNSDDIEQCEMVSSMPQVLEVGSENNDRWSKPTKRKFDETIDMRCKDAVRYSKKIHFWSEDQKFSEHRKFLQEESLVSQHQLYSPHYYIISTISLSVKVPII